MRKLACAVVLTASISGTAVAVQINEIRIDQPGVDSDEYVELFGVPGSSLDGLTYVIIGDGASGSGQVEMARDLTGHAMGGSGFFLAAEDGAALGAVADLDASLNFENNDNVTHLLVTGFTGSNGNDLDTDDDGVLDALPWTSIVDGLALVDEPAVPPVGTEYHYASQLGLPAIGPDGSTVPGHIFRLPDGGAFHIGLFDPLGGRDTPGAANVPEPSSLLLVGVAAALCCLGGRRFGAASPVL